MAAANIRSWYFNAASRPSRLVKSSNHLRIEEKKKTHAKINFPDPELSDAEEIPELQHEEDIGGPDPLFDPSAELKTRKGRKSVKYFDSSEGENGRPAPRKSKKGKASKKKADESPATFICGICFAPFASVEGLRTHHRNSERCSKFEPGMVFKCDVCFKVFLSQSYLDEHRAWRPACRIVRKDNKNYNKNDPNSSGNADGPEVDGSRVGCPTCKTTFSSLYALRIHLKSFRSCSYKKTVGTNSVTVTGTQKTSQPVFVCKTCHVHFNSQLGLGLHWKRSLKCSENNQSAPTPGPLEQSKGDESSKDKSSKDSQVENVFVCTKCYASFSSVWGLRTHERSSKKCKPDRPYEIPVAMSKEKADQLKKEFQEKEAAGAGGSDRNEEAKKSGEKKSDGNFKCGECSAVFTSIHGLRTHQRKTEMCRTNDVIVPINSENVCPKCSAKFSTAWGLRTHLRNSENCKEDPTNDPAYSCDNCAEAFGGFADFRKHFKLNPACNAAGSRLSEKAQNNKISGCFLCPQCPKTFQLPTSLEQHFVEHASSDIWDCPKCRLVCMDSFELQRHFRNDHDGSWFCILCIDVPLGDRNIFKSFKNLYAHMFEEHAKDEGNAKKYFRCLTCYRSFFSKSSLDLHVSHCRMMAEKTFTCASCLKIFTKKIHIMNHIKYAHEDRTIDHRYSFKCPKCPRKFLSEQDWRYKHEKEECNHEELKCKECGAMYVGTEKLRDHMKLCHADVRSKTLPENLIHQEAPKPEIPVECPAPPQVEQEESKSVVCLSEELESPLSPEPEDRNTTDFPSIEIKLEPNY